MMHDTAILCRIWTCQISPNHLGMSNITNEYSSHPWSLESQKRLYVALNLYRILHCRMGHVTGAPSGPSVQRPGLYS